MEDKADLEKIFESYYVKGLTLNDKPPFQSKKQNTCKAMEKVNMHQNNWQSIPKANSTGGKEI